VLARWQPFREVTSLQERVNQLFNDVFSDIDSPGAGVEKVGSEPEKITMYVGRNRKPVFLMEMAILARGPKSCTKSGAVNCRSIRRHRFCYTSPDDDPRKHPVFVSQPPVTSREVTIPAPIVSNGVRGTLRPSYTNFTLSLDAD
jgi:hypothetical protein